MTVLRLIDNAIICAERLGFPLFNHSPLPESVVAIATHVLFVEKTAEVFQGLKTKNCGPGMCDTLFALLRKVATWDISAGEAMFKEGFSGMNDEVTTAEDFYLLCIYTLYWCYEQTEAGTGEELLRGLSQQELDDYVGSENEDDKADGDTSPMGKIVHRSQKMSCEEGLQVCTESPSASKNRGSASEPTSPLASKLLVMKKKMMKSPCGGVLPEEGIKKQPLEDDEPVSPMSEALKIKSGLSASEFLIMRRDSGVNADDSQGEKECAHLGS